MSARAAAMAQVNIRMDPTLKAAGDATLCAVDVSPSQLIRAVWQKLAQGIEAFDQLATTLAQDSPQLVANSAEANAAAEQLVCNIQQRQALLEQTWGLDASTYAPISDEALQELVFDELVSREALRAAHHAQ